MKPKGKMVIADHSHKDNSMINIDSRKRSNHRAKKTIIDLFNNNFYNKNCYFITLTFRDNIDDVELANKIFKSFIRKMRIHSKSQFKYISVIEFQKRGAIHYHMITDNEELNYSNVIKYWNNSINSHLLVKDGYVRIEKIHKHENSKVLSYVMKYVSKALGNEKLLGKKCYFSSRNLYRSKKHNALIENAINLDILKKLNINGKIIKKSYYNDSYNGQKIEYFLININ
ncbi:rolling circle replication-associated protein [Apilactobacillus micheneri]|nr:hypothetical protein [Apilactobacillus micheneri]